MTWEEYYENYYDWAESTAIKKLSSVDVLGKADTAFDTIIQLIF